MDSARFYVAAAAVLGIASAARASVITAVDIGTASSPVYSGSFTSPVDASTGTFVGGSFPTVANATPSNFSVIGTNPTYSTGTVTFTLSSFNSSADRGNQTDTVGTYQAVYEDQVIAQSGTLTISGLNPSTAYGITLQSFESVENDPDTFTPVTTGVTNPAAEGTISHPGTPNGYSVGNYLYNDPGGDYANVSFYGANALTTDSAGNIVFNLTGGGGFQRINGIEIYTATPEPASLTLLRLGALGVLGRRRRPDTN